MPSVPCEQLPARSTTISDTELLLPPVTCMPTCQQPVISPFLITTAFDDPDDVVLVIALPQAPDVQLRAYPLKSRVTPLPRVMQLPDDALTAR